MALVVADDGVRLTTLRFVEVKSNGSYQYRRRIPAALQAHYGGKSFFVRSLKRDKSKIQERCYTLTSQIERDWIALGWKPTEFDAKCTSFSASNVPHENKEQVLTADRGTSLSEALQIYISLGSGRNAKFLSDTKREMARLKKICGDLPVQAFRREHAQRFRDVQLKSCSTATVRRRLTIIVAVFNRVIREKQLQIMNPFEGLGIAGEGEDGAKRIPFTSDELRIVSMACRNFDDDIRRVVAFQIDTGCRVAEIVGLRIEDVILDAPVPHVRIRPWRKVRTLKTPASERDIPLVGHALWAAERALEARRIAADGSSWLFPRYASDKEIKANHASAALNKWIRSLAGVCDKKTTHCLRHAMRDRLRAAQVPTEIQDCLGGWGTRTIGQGYGNGYPLSVLAEHMRKIV